MKPAGLPLGILPWTVLMTVLVIVFGLNALRCSESFRFSSMPAFIFWSSSDSRLHFLGGDSMSEVSNLLVVILRGLTFGPNVFRISDL